MHSRSFDILPLAEDVEFADMASPPTDSWGVADGSVDLMSGIANLTNGRDLPGFFWCCAHPNPDPNPNPNPDLTLTLTLTLALPLPLTVEGPTTTTSLSRPP